MGLREAIDKVNEAIENSKKLTTKDRKKMKKGTFCGPNRSFPVNDCAHVRAAKVYLKRSNFSADQQARIAACINRKAKALGCPGTKPAKGKGALEIEFMPDILDLANSEIFKTTKDLVDKSVNTPNLNLDFSDCEDND